MTLIEHFRGLLKYEAWANELAVASIESVPASRRTGPAWDRLTRLMPHVILARQAWLWRLQKTPYQNPIDWFPPMEIAEVRKRLTELDAAWGAYVATLRDADLERECLYTSSEGKRFTSTTGEIITHVLTHSMYHRGQVARLVTECGGARSPTDYIGMVRKALD